MGDTTKEDPPSFSAIVLPSSLVLVLLLLLVEVPAADCSLLVTGLMIVSLNDLATDLVSALIIIVYFFLFLILFPIFLYLLMASKSPLDTLLWKVELLFLPPESPPSLWKPSSSGSTLPSRLPRPLSSEEANEGTDFLLCLLPWDSTSDIALFF